ncbi:MAG: DOPA 4,5-dioxygenase family protein [Bacteriovoracaceae bacterium]|jgi:DOPA 4,5-dioxygenase|nr:DOPA 4,5-dioxygenase family protein [Bacteriovoracaceae bacterium]
MQINAYHAHLYYTQKNIDKVYNLVEKLKPLNLCQIGTIHKKNVGPHPMWSCQLLFSEQNLSSIVSFLLKNRGDIIVFFHGLSGNDLLDHTDYTFWMGDAQKLNLEIFNN